MSDNQGVTPKHLQNLGNPVPKDLSTDIETKVCSVCGVNKLLSEYTLDRRRTRVHPKPRCKVCTAAYTRDHYERNKDLVISKAQAYRQKNWERLKQAAYDYTKRNPNKQRARQAVNNAITAKKLERKICQSCGFDKVDFHHSNG